MCNGCLLDCCFLKISALLKIVASRLLLSWDCCVNLALGCCVHLYCCVLIVALFCIVAFLGLLRSSSPWNCCVNLYCCAQIVAFAWIVASQLWHW